MRKKKRYRIIEQGKFFFVQRRILLFLWVYLYQMVAYETYAAIHFDSLEEAENFIGDRIERKNHKIPKSKIVKYL